jgi:hypothetical protein
VPNARVDAEPLRRGEGLDERRELAVRCGVIGHVCVHEVTPRPDDLKHAVGLRLRRGLAEARPVGGCRAAAGQAGVDLEMNPCRPTRAAGGGSDLLEQPDGGGREVNVRGHAIGERQSRRQQPREHGSLQAGQAQLERLAESADPEPGRTAPQRRTSRRNHAVAVSVTLDHGHDLRGRTGLQVRDVGPDRLQVDTHLRLPHAPSLTGE